MPITISNDKTLIKAILDTDPYIARAGFAASYIYKYKANDNTLSSTSQQIFIYNTTPESVSNPIVHGIVYEIDVLAPYAKQGSVDAAIEQIVALLDGTEISRGHTLDLLDPPTTLVSTTSLYQVGVKFICYETAFNAVRI